MKRLNPETNQPFKRGERRQDGFIFESYNKCKTAKNGYFAEVWRDPKKFEQRVKFTTTRRASIEKTKEGHVTVFLRAVRARARNKNLPFNLDKDYLLSIATDECPVFKFPFDWGIDGKGHDPKGPSLDRVIPELGYVKGNVVFISILANTIKSNVTEKELYAVADWLHDKRKEVLNAFKDKPAPVPDALDTASKKHSQHGSVLGPRVGQDCDGSQHYRGELPGAYAGDRTQAGGSVRVGAGV